MREIVALSSVVVLLAGCSSIPATAVEPSPRAIANEHLRLKPVLKLDTLWQEEFHVDALTNSVFEIANEFLDSQSGECQYEAIVEIQEPSEVNATIVPIAEAIPAFFCGQIYDDVHVVVGSYGYLKDYLAEYNLPTDDHGGLCGPPSSGMSTACALYHGTWVKDTGSARLMQLFTAHEIFHVVQDALRPTNPPWRAAPDEAAFTPSWFSEGSATTWQYILINRLGYGPKDLEILVNNDIDKINLKELEQGWDGKVYGHGNFATAYLIANIGVDNFFQILADIENGYTFSESFEKNAGISLDDFYVKVGKLVVTYK